MNYPETILTTEKRKALLEMINDALCQIRISDIETTSRIADGFASLPLLIFDKTIDTNNLILYLDAIDGTENNWGKWAKDVAEILDIKLPIKTEVLPWLKSKAHWALYADASTYNEKWINYYKNLEISKERSIERESYSALTVSENIRTIKIYCITVGLILGGIITALFYIRPYLVIPGGLLCIVGVLGYIKWFLNSKRKTSNGETV